MEDIFCYCKDSTIYTELNFTLKKQNESQETLGKVTVETKTIIVKSADLGSCHTRSAQSFAQDFCAHTGQRASLAATAQTRQR